MKKLFLYVFLGLLWCNVGIAGKLAEPWTIDNWEIEETEKSIKVRTEGTTQKGDRLTLWVDKSACNKVEHTFSFYTAKRVSSIKDIEGKEVVAKTLGKKTLVNLKYIISAKPTMDGDFAFFSLGHYELDKHIEFLEEYKNFDVKLEFIFADSERKNGWDASDFFDILNNSWNLEGVRLALEDAVSLCEWRIENPLETKNISSETNVSPGKNIKDMKITCSSNDYFIQGLFEKIEKKENHTYEIDIVNNVASLVHSTNTTYHSYYNYPLYTMTDKEYLFSKQETIANNSEHVSTSKIHFNRIKGTAIIVYFDYYKDEPTKHLHWEMINAKDCKASDIDDKPKF